MTPDSNGILMLEETDPITPFQTTINTLQAATSDVIGDTITGVTTNTTQLSRLPVRMAAGFINLGTITNSLVTNVSLPAGRFTQPPIVVGTISNAQSGTGTATVRIDQTTTSQFRVIIAGVVGTVSNVNLAWHAIQMTPTSGAG